MNPRFVFGKVPIFGKTFMRFASGKPYQRASVAAYCSTDVVESSDSCTGTTVGIVRPLKVSVGNGVPFVVLIP